MTVPTSAARFLGRPLDRTVRGIDQKGVLDVSENQLAAASANFAIVADTHSAFGNAYQLYRTTSDPAGTTGPDITFTLSHKHLGDPQSDAGNKTSFLELFIHAKLSVASASWTGTAPGNLEIGSIETVADARGHSLRLLQNGTVTLINRAGAVSGTPGPSSAVGAFPLNTSRRLQQHIRSSVSGGAAGRLAFRIETSTPNTYASWVETDDANITQSLMERIRFSARDVAANLGGISTPEIRLQEVGWYTPLTIDSSLTVEEKMAYAVPSPFALCRTCDVGATSAKVLIAIPENALDDGGEAEYEYGTLNGSSPSLGEPLPLGDPGLGVDIIGTDTVTLGATFRGIHVEFPSLTADTVYAWRVTAGGSTSDWRVFRTAPAPGTARTLRYVVLTHCHSDGRRTPNVSARRAAEMYADGLIDFVIAGPKFLMHLDNNGQLAPALTLGEAWDSFVATGMDPFVAQLSQTGCPLFYMSDDYDGYPTNTGKWIQAIPDSYPGGHPLTPAAIRFFPDGYDSAGNGNTTGIGDIAPDTDFDFTAGRAVTMNTMGLLGENVFDTFIKPGFLDATEDWRFIQWGKVILAFLYDRSTREPDATGDFFGAAQIAAVTAKIAESNGANLVEIWTPSTVGDEDASTNESWATWATERAAALQEWEDAALAADKYLAYHSSCKDEPAVCEPSLLQALLATNHNRIVAYSFIGKSWGRIVSNNANLIDGVSPAAGIIAAFRADGVNTLTDPLAGGSRTVVASDHVGWVPYCETNPSGTGTRVTKLLDVVTMTPVSDATYGSFDTTQSLGLPITTFRAAPGRTRHRGLMPRYPN